MPTRKALIRALARLERSPLPATEPVRLALEAELIALIVEAERRAPRLTSYVVGSA